MVLVPQAVTRNSLSQLICEIFFCFGFKCRFLDRLRTTILQHWLEVDGTYWKVLCHQSLTHLENLTQKPFYLYPFLWLVFHVYEDAFIPRTQTISYCSTPCLDEYICLLNKLSLFTKGKKKKRKNP